MSKKTYTKKQIQKAIAHWQKVLESMEIEEQQINESTNNDISFADFLAQLRKRLDNFGTGNNRYRYDTRSLKGFKVKVYATDERNTNLDIEGYVENVGKMEDRPYDIFGVQGKQYDEVKSKFKFDDYFLVELNSKYSAGCDYYQTFVRMIDDVCYGSSSPEVTRMKSFGVIVGDASEGSYECTKFIDVTRVKSVRVDNNHNVIEIYVEGKIIDYTNDVDGSFITGRSRRTDLQNAKLKNREAFINSKQHQRDEYGRELGKFRAADSIDSKYSTKLRNRDDVPHVGKKEEDKEISETRVYEIGQRIERNVSRAFDKAEEHNRPVVPGDLRVTEDNRDDLEEEVLDKLFGGGNDKQHNDIGPENAWNLYGDMIDCSKEEFIAFYNYVKENGY